MTKGVLALTATNFIYYAGIYVTFGVLQSYALKRGADPIQIGWIGSAFFLGALAARPVGAWLVVRAGRHFTLLAGSLLSAAACALLPLLTTPARISGGRVLHGAATALFSTSVTLLVADHAPPSRRGEALGVFGASTNAAAAVGPAVGLLLVHGLGYDWAFGAAVLASFAGAAGAAAMLTPRSTGRERVLITSETPAGDRLTGSLAVSSLVIMAFGLTYSVHVGFIVAVASARGMEGHVAGLYYTCYAAGIVTARLVGGRVSDRYGRGWVIAPGSLAAALAMVCLSIADGPSVLFAAAVIYGLGAGSVHPGVLSRMIDLAPAPRRGVAVAAFYAAFEIGIIVAGPLFGWMVSRAGYGGSLKVLAIAPAVGVALYICSTQLRRDELKAGEVLNERIRSRSDGGRRLGTGAPYLPRRDCDGSGDFRDRGPELGEVGRGTFA